MFKRIISSILIIIILTLWMPIEALQEVFKSVAAETISEEFVYTGGLQTFEAENTGVYQIEAYGAQGKGTSTYKGGKGSSAKGTITLQKGDTLNIYVGGKNGYNGGGAKNGDRLAGGGASDIRYGGTEIENRILVAAGGGGAKETLHSHTTSCSKATCTVTEISSTRTSAGYSATCTHTYDEVEFIYREGYVKHNGCGAGDYVHSKIGPGCYCHTGSLNTTHTYYTCGKEGKIDTSKSSAGKGETEGYATTTLYQGNKGGGGGYYGGKAGYGGTSYVDTTYFTSYAAEDIETGVQEGNGYVKITLLSSEPEIDLTASITENTNQDVILTATVADTSDLPENPYSWNDGERVSQNQYTATKNGTYKVNVINNAGLSSEESYTVDNIDKLKPTVNETYQAISEDKKSVNITLNGIDNSSNDYIATGVVEYALTKQNRQPSTFDSTNIFTVTENGTYYGWVKDAVGNVSEGRAILVTSIEEEISGSITWDDQSNKYSSRKATNIGLYRKVGENEAYTLVETKKIEAGQTTYSFQTRQCDDAGNEYSFKIQQDNVDGYETLYSISYDGIMGVYNTLILPTYTSDVVVEPKNSFQNKLLKNGNAKITATIEASDSNREELGVHNGQAVLNVDPNITINQSSIVVTYEDVNGNKTNITNYTVSGNTITTIFGNTNESISTKGTKVTIEVEGTLQNIGNYNNNVSFSGKLRDYRGTNTDIDLGTVTQNQKQITVENQLPEANIQIRNVDSITENTLTDATFTLYEWDGSKYVAKETITDTNKDGIYESKAYRWNSTSQGKYKIVETSVPTYHEDLNFSMEYSLTELHTENYMVTVDYSNTSYAIKYVKRNPDDLDRINGTVENEPWKLKAQIEKVDLQTKNIIQAETEFAVYEWNNTTSKYEQYQSYTSNGQVNMIRQQDKTYLTGEWLYYTPKNEGKYRIIETKAPEGYYGNYTQTGEKVVYDINVLESIENGTYNNQTVENAGTIKISNNNENQITNERVKATLNVVVVDSQTKGKAQADATINNAKYGIYAYEQINHSDGVTTRYEGEPGVLYKQDELIDIQYTNELGQMTFDNLECGIYYLKMIEAPKGYVLDESKYKIDFSYQGEDKKHLEMTGQIEIKIQKQAFQIHKVKENLESLNNAGFSIYLINDLSIVKDGKITKATTNTYTLNDNNAKQDERLKQKVNTDGTYNLEDLIDYYYKIYNAEEQDAAAMPGDEYVYNPYKLQNETTAKDYSTSQEGTIITEIRTNESGYLISPELAYGEYIVIETSVPRAHEATKPFIVEVKEDNRQPQEIRIIVDDDFKTRVKIYKKDMETNKIILKENASYVIRNAETNELVTKNVWEATKGYVEYGTLENPFKTSNKGYIITPIELNVGKYILEEIKAPEGYTLNGYEGTSENGQIKWQREEKLNFSISTNTAYYTDSYLGKHIIVVDQENKSVVGTIKIKSATGEFLSSVEKGEPYTFTYETRAVEGVKYKVCAKENIYTQDNQGTLIYSKDEVIAFLTTDKDGYAIIENLPLGKYYIKEVETVAGFALNEEQKDIEIAYEGQEVPVVFKEVKTEEIRQKIEILIHNKDTQTNEIRTGGQYALFTKSEIQYIDAEGNIQTISANEKIITLTSNEQGKIEINEKTNLDLPRGRYYLKEIEAPKGYTLQTQTIDIDTTIQGIVDTIRIEKEFKGIETNINIVEINEEEKMTTDSTFEIRNKATNETLRQWTTKGQVENIKNLETNIEYVLVETNPCKGYTTAEQVTFVIKEDGALWINSQKQEDNTITVRDYKTILQMHIKEEVTKEYAKGSTWQILQNNQKIVEWTTNAEMQQIEKLPIGEYVLRETSIGENTGYVTNEDITFNVNDTKDIQKVEVQEEVSKLEIHIKDEITKEYAKGSTWQIVSKDGKIVREFVTNGAKYETTSIPVGEYTLKQVAIGENTGYVTNAEGTFNVTDTRNTQVLNLEQKVSKVEIHIKDEVTKEYAKGSTWQILDKDQKVIREFAANGQKYETTSIPVGEYILKQVAIGENTGYVTNEEITIKIEETRELQVVNLEQKVSRIEIHITDEITKEYAQGSTWQILDKDGKVVREFATNSAKYETTSIPVGEYTLKQVAIGENTGYVTNEEITIKIEDTRELQVINLEQKVSKLEIHIKDEITKEYAKGSTWQIVSKDGKIVREFVTKGAKYETTSIPVGEYTLKQIAIGENTGYVTNADMNFEVSDTRELQVVNLEQKVSKLEIHIIDEITKEYTKGSTWQILDKDQKVIREFVTNGAKYETTSIPVGEYTLKQVTIGENTGYVTNAEVKFNIIDTRELQILNLEQKVSKVEIHIKDEVTKEYAQGSTWQILDKDQKVIREFVTNGQKYETTSIPVGEYILKQVAIGENTGYVTNEEITIKIEDTRELQVVNLEQKVSRIEIHITDEITKEYAKGSIWQILDKDQKVVREFVANGGKYETTSIPVGEYTLKQVAIGENTGYVTNAEISFNVTDTRETQIVEFGQVVSRIEFHIKEKNAGKYVEGSTWQLIKKLQENSEEVIVRQWTSNGQKYETTSISVGEYILREVSIGENTGYVTNEDLVIKVEDTREIQAFEIEQNLTQLQIHIKDETTKEYVEGSTWQIVRNTEEKEVLREWTANGVAYETIKLPVGEYILREATIGENTGYVTNEEILIKVEDTLKTQTLEVEQKVSKIEIHIKDEVTKEYSKGSTWQIIKVTEETETTEEKEEIVREFVTNGAKYETTSIPVGDYILREISTGENTGYVTNEDILIKIQDTREVQVVDLEQKVSKVEIHIKDEITKEYAQSSTWQIIKVVDDKEEILKEFTTNSEKYEVDSLPVGEYILRQTSIGKNTGYVTNEDVLIKVENMLQPQILEVEQKVSKLIVNLQDIKTEQHVKGAKLQLLTVLGETQEVLREWETEEQGTIQEKLPVGNYMLRQVYTPTNQGYITIDETEVEVKDTLEEQQINIIQDISKLLLTLEDQETKEKLEAKDIVIKDKEGKIIASTEEQENVLKIEKTEAGYYLERLPVETEYQLAEITPEGYKPIESRKVSIKDIKEEQQLNLTTRKLIINIELDKQLENIIVNGEKTKAYENEIMKVEVKERKIETTELEFEYKILVTNTGEAEAIVEKIIDKIPSGCICEESKNPNWIISNKEAIYKESIKLKPNESKELTIIMKWKNSKTNFGEIKNIVEAEGITNRYNYKNASDSTDTASVVISVGTGLEEKVTTVRIIVIALTASMVICLFAGVEIMILKKKQIK